MTIWTRIAAVAAATLLLAGCLLSPGKFTSNLTVNADRSFDFTYVGEVYATDPSDSMPSSDDEKDKAAAAATAAKKKAEVDTKMRAIAEALSKEQGYRSVRYVGDRKFLVDYRITGRLDHHFTFPFNADAQAIVPFLMIELRANGTVRMKAPGFAAEQASSQAGGLAGTPAADTNAKLDGVFTLNTDAEIVSQNSEDGATAAGARKTVSWRATPLSRDAPTAVLRLR